MQSEAIALQLEASRRAAKLNAMVLADEDGLCVASSGNMPNDEIAVYTAMLGNKVENFEGMLYSKDNCFNVRIRRFSLGDQRLFLCAVGGGGEARANEIHRSLGGVQRILSAA